MHKIDETLESNVAEIKISSIIDEQKEAPTSIFDEVDVDVLPKSEMSFEGSGDSFA